MKILHMHTSMRQGGIAAVICGLVNEMSKQYDVSLCTIYNIDSKDVAEKNLSPHVKRYSLRKLRQGFSFVEVFRILKFIYKGKFDIVHIHGFFYYYVLSVLLLHHRTQFIYTIHNDAQKECSKWDRRILFIKKFALGHNWIHPVTISKESKRSFTEFYHLGSTLIYNGIDAYNGTPNKDLLSKYKITPQTRVFLNPGRIVEQKNQKVLCQVFSQLIQEGKDVVLLIAGSKDDDHIFNEIRQYFSERIIYIGERNDVRDLLYYADAFCLPSLWEGMPVTLLEAISVGCIPICAPVGGIPEFVTDGETGFLSNNSSNVSYYDAVSRFLLMTEQNRANMRKRCIELSKDFSMENIANQYLNLYMSLLHHDNKIKK